MDKVMRFRMGVVFFVAFVLGNGFLLVRTNAGFNMDVWLFVFLCLLLVVSVIFIGIIGQYNGVKQGASKEIIDELVLKRKFVDQEKGKNSITTLSKGDYKGLYLDFMASGEKSASVGKASFKNEQMLARKLREYENWKSNSVKK